jgi:hypothetical protein
MILFVNNDHYCDKFKENVHCSQEIVVLYLNKEFHRQKHSRLTAAEELNGIKLKYSEGTLTNPS